MAGSFRRDHDDIEIGTRLDLLVMNIKAMSKGQCGTLLDVGCNAVTVQACLVFIRRQHHHHVRSLHSVINRLYGKTGFLCLGLGD